jgi:dTDP-glucose 4,6-dehydratase
LREQQIDTIAHFAAESHVDRSITGPAAFVQTNLVGTFTLLEAARRPGEMKRKRNFAGFTIFPPMRSTGRSSATIRRSVKPRRMRRIRPYSASKAGSDHLVRAYFHTYGLPVVTTNCSNNYGPFQHGEKFIPTVIRSCLLQKPIPVYGDGSNIRDWLYVEDHCRGIDAVIRRGQLGETYNIVL